MKHKLAFIALLSVLVFLSCEQPYQDKDDEDDDPDVVITSDCTMTSFSFLATNNSYSELNVDCVGVIGTPTNYKATISINVPLVTDTVFTPSFTIPSGTSAYYINDQGSTIYLTSGQSGIDFLEPVTITVEHTSGAKIDYEINVQYLYDVYVCGYLNSTPCYWVNGSRSLLSLGTAGYGSLSAIAVDNGFIYTSGTLGTTPYYWEGPTRHDLLLDAGFTRGDATDIAIYEGDVYVSGYEVNGTTWLEVAGYWVNGSFTALPCFDSLNHTYNARALSICVSPIGDVYVSGYSENGNDVKVACYWKNGVFHSLAYSPETLDTDTEANSIVFEDDYLYIGGLTRDASGYPKATTWKNDNKTVRNNYGNILKLSVFQSYISMIGESYKYGDVGVDGPWFWYYWNGYDGDYRAPFGVVRGVCAGNRKMVFTCGNLAGSNVPAAYMNETPLVLNHNNLSGCALDILVIPR